jgi:fructokinase
MNKEILCVGEVLWDALPAGLFLGGAPFNVACHLHMLGEAVAFVSRVGDDVLGREVVRRLALRGMEADLVQVDPARPTGFVEVTLDADGVPSYVIVEPAAWDAIALTDALAERAEAAGVVVFGSLAQRHVPSRQTIQALAETRALKVFDINLRPPFVDRAVVEAALHAADVVKLNDDELHQMAQWWGLSAPLQATVAGLARRFGNGAVCLTRGAHGAALWREGRWTEHPGFRVAVKDTVGAGDAFLAGLLSRLLAGQDDHEVLAFANRLGAYVASQFGATPAYQLADLEAVPPSP